MNNEIRKDFLAGKFERTEDGIYFPSSRLLAKGVFRYNKRGEPEEYSENLVVNQGLDYLLGAGVNGASSISNWYIAPYSGNVTVLATWTAANFTATATEWTLYTSATRPAWSKGAVASGGIDSFATKAEFESTADTQTVRGAALISVATKSAITGTLMAASNFPSAKALDTDEILDIGYGLQLTAV
jgi:hypothetical protein